jgi:hypothetical protein
MEKPLSGPKGLPGKIWGPAGRKILVILPPFPGGRSYSVGIGKKTG